MYPRGFRRTSAALVLASAALCCAPQQRRGPPARARVAAEHAPRSDVHEAFAELRGDAGLADVWLLSGNAEAWATRWKLISEAKTSIDAAYFIVANDPLGLAFIGLLRRKAAEGVKVRLLIDGRGSAELASPLAGIDFLNELQEVGDVEVRIYNPMAARLPEALARMKAAPVGASTHFKLLIVDREVAVTGGRNVSRKYFSDPRDFPQAWLDAEVVVRGPRAIVKLASTFSSEVSGEASSRLLPDLIDAVPRHDVLAMHAAAMDAWLAFPPLSAADARALRENEAVVLETARALEEEAVNRLGRLPAHPALVEYRLRAAELVRLPHLRGARAETEPPDDAVEIKVLYKPSRLGKRADTITPAIKALLRAAQKEIFLETPYFVLTLDMLEDLQLAGRRGVPITVLTNGPRTSDNDVGSALFFEEWPEILARVPSMRLFVLDGARPLHAKRAVFDGEMTMVGTYNLDPLSETMNSELAVLVHSPFFAQRNLREIVGRRSSPDVVEYRIARDAEGAALRDRAGRVVQVKGPADHVPPERLAQLHELKQALLNAKRFFDFEPAVW